MDDAKVIYLSGCYEDIHVTKSVTRVQTAEVPEMATDHIESDARMLFLMCCLNEDFNRSRTNASVVVSSGDTDVLLLACYHAEFLDNITDLYWETNTTTKHSNMCQVFLIQTIPDHVDPMLMSILPHIHALTGCATISAFFFLEKKTILKTLNKSKEATETQIIGLQQYSGSSWCFTSACSCPLWQQVSISTLTYWGRDKMADISQTTFSNVFSSMKMFKFRSKFHWSLFLRTQLTKFQHWFR